ncbi:MAG: PPOX class F420-dependent oxidoreductase [Anaerolineales bacterium]|nr:PPOX class F420-dependent oxidoreductase [Anaerolineales bacterium]
MKRMSPEECKAFLMAAPRTAKLATVRADGRPHVAPIWFWLDGDTLLFTTWHESVKARNMRREPRVSLCVDDEQPPFSFVLVDGEASFDDDADALRHWATRIGGRYMGADQADAFGRRNSVAGELLVRVAITKLLGQTDVSGW